MKQLLACALLISGMAFAQKGIHPELEPAFKSADSSAERNIFLNAKTSASGVFENNKPELAVDGKFFDANSHWGAENLPNWHQIELAKPEILTEIRIVPYWLDNRIYKYKIEGSLDGENWQVLVDASGNSIAYGEHGFNHTFAPQKVKYVRTTVLENSRGAKNGSHIVEIEGFSKTTSGKLLGFAGTTDERYSRDLAITETGKLSTKVTAWKGERTNAQFVVKVPRGIKELKIFQGKNPEAINVNPNFVRFVGSNRGQQADILEDLKVVKTTPSETRSIWLDIDIDRNIKQGVYTYTFKVGENLANSIEFSVDIEVLQHQIPDNKDWIVHLDLWQTPDCLARFHQVKPWSDEHFAIMKPHYQRLAKAGQRYITTTIIYEAWNMQSYDYLPGMVKWIKGTDGKMRYDFSIFEKWVTFMREEVGIKDYISCYSMIPWSLSYRYYDEATGADVDVKLEPGTKQYEEFWGDFLVHFRAFLKKKNWLEITRMGIDERPDRWVLPTIEVVKKYAPELKIISANNHLTDKTMGIVDVSPILSLVDNSRANLNQRKKNGLVSTFYVCTHPSRPNTFTFSIPAESEWLMIYAAANNLDGFLRWAFDNFVEDPLTNTDYPGKGWPTGDCFMVYPGNRSSVRWEKFYDGLEVFEKINLLRRVAKAKNREADLAELEKHLTATYTWARGQRAENPYAEDNAKTNKLINELATKILD